MDEGLRAFADWMSGGGPDGPWLVLTAVAAMLLAPVLVVVHELGHAAVGLAATEGLVEVHIGRPPAWWKPRIGRLALELSPIPARNGPAGLATVFARCGVVTEVLLTLAGPVAEAAAAGAIVFVGARTNLLFIQIAGAIGIVDALLSFIPRSVHGMRSDGGYLLDALRQAGGSKESDKGSAADPFERSLQDTLTRWFVLFTDERSVRETERCGELLAAAPAALGYSRDEQRATALALWRLAFAGWCWREAERGDPVRVREAALDALHAARVAGALGLDLVALAATELASSRVELGLASPGTHDAERIRFLATALARLPAFLRPASVLPNEQHFAFRYGVALNDIERVQRVDIA